MAKVLVVDDSSLSRRTLKRILEEAGHQVVEAGDGLAGLESYFIHRPDVVVLDLIMSGMSGTDMLLQLKHMDPNARVVVVSADIQESTRRIVLQAGARVFLSKPVEPKDLREALAQALTA